MKRIFPAIALILCVLLITAGCRREASPAPGFGKEDLSLIIGGTGYGLNTDIETVIAGLGSDYAYSEAISCDHDGLDKTFAYDIAQFYTYPLPEGDLVCEIYTESPDVSASGGIRVGAAKEDVLAVYGGDCEDTGYQLVYSLPASRETVDGGSLCFDMEDGAVKAIYITTRPF